MLDKHAVTGTEECWDFHNWKWCKLTYTRYEYWTDGVVFASVSNEDEYIENPKIHSVTEPIFFHNISLRFRTEGSFWRNFERSLGGRPEGPHCHHLRHGRREERHHRGGDGGGDWKFCLDRINDNQMLSDFTSLNVWSQLNLVFTWTLVLYVTKATNMKIDDLHDLPWPRSTSVLFWEGGLDISLDLANWRRRLIHNRMTINCLVIWLISQKCFPLQPSVPTYPGENEHSTFLTIHTDNLDLIL